jgi:alkylhydroperoxidase family enzyme
MSWIRTIPPEEARGALKREYDAALRRAGKVFQILRIQSLNPAALHDSMRMYLTIMFGPSPLSRMQRELLATVVSAANACRY